MINRYFLNIRIIKNSTLLIILKTDNVFENEHIVRFF